MDADELNKEYGPVTASTVYYFRLAAHNSKGASPPSELVVIKTPDGKRTINPEETLAFLSYS